MRSISRLVARLIRRCLTTLTINRFRSYDTTAAAVEASSLDAAASETTRHGEEGADDDPKKIENRKRSKSKKREKNEESSMGIDESQSIGAVKNIEHMLRREEKKQHRRDEEEKTNKSKSKKQEKKEDIAAMKKQRRRDKGKKKTEGTKDIEGVDIEKKGVKESKRVYGADVNDDATDNAARQRTKREKKSRIEGDKSKKMLDEESVYIVKIGKEAKKERKKNDHKDGDIERVGDKEDGKVFGAQSENSEVNIMGIVERKKRKREKKRSTSKSEKMSETLNEANIEDFVEKTERKKKKRIKLVDNDLVTPTPNKSNKKVRFSGEDEVFNLAGDSSENYDEDGLLRGKRFTPEEDEIVKQAVFKFIADNDLGEEGLDMVLDSRKHRTLRGCWKERASAIPYRPYTAFYGRAQKLFRRSEGRKWTQEEFDLIINYQKEHGNHWRALADELGKDMWQVRNAWCRIKLKDMKRGHWSQSEYQKLFDLVHTDLKLKVSQDKKMKYGMLRDNICWQVISDELSTRTGLNCCNKWYYQLTSRMVMEGVWADSDDYLLVGALYNLDATCMEDVDWDDLIDGRSGELCRKRWSQMVLHIGHHGLKSFGEQVDVMAQRYCPHLLEAREIWDSKPRVP